MMFGEVTEMRPVHPEWYNEIWAVERHGYRWMSWVGIPTKSAPDYPKRCRVRQLLSPRQLESKEWQDMLAESEGREADGSEPLAYTYCSSRCTVELTPDLIGDELAAELSRCVHDACERVPHSRFPQNIGVRLAEVVRQHLDKALRE